METMMSNNMINLKDAINEMIYNSSDVKLKSFYNSSHGRFLFDVLEMSHSSFNYTSNMLVDELNITTAKQETNVIRLANELSYHLKHRIPAKAEIGIRVINVNDARWNSISNVELIGGEFTANIGQYNFVQMSDFKFNKHNINRFNMYQVSPKSYKFNIAVKGDWNTVTIPDSVNIVNYINTGLGLDATLTKIESNNTETPYSVIRSVPSESDLVDGNFVMSSVTEDKELKLIFGNGTFGSRGYGNYIFNYYTTAGKNANYSSPINTSVAFSNIGINVYDINGNLIENPYFITEMFDLYTTNEIIGGEDVDNIEDIRYKAMRSNAINNTLLNSNDFSYYVKDRFAISDIYFWGDDIENGIRAFDRKDNFNTTFCTSKSIKYDFDLNANIRYDLLTNKIEISKSNRDYNPNSFDIVPDCDRYAHKKLDDCLSFKTLYILGRIKPIAYYHSLLKDDNSLITSMFKSIKDKSVDFNTIFIEADTLNINATVSVSGSSSKSDAEIKQAMLDEYNNKNSNKFNIDGSFRQALVDTNYTVNAISLSPVYNISMINSDLNAIMVLYGVGEFDRILVNNILSQLSLSLGTYTTVSSCLRAISNYIDTLYPYITQTNKEVIKSILTHCVNKYNETKTNMINSGNIAGLDIPLIQFNISDINLIKE